MTAPMYMAEKVPEAILRADFAIYFREKSREEMFLAEAEIWLVNVSWELERVPTTVSEVFIHT